MSYLVAHRTYPGSIELTTELLLAFYESLKGNLDRANQLRFVPLHTAISLNSLPQAFSAAPNEAEISFHDLTVEVEVLRVSIWRATSFPQIVALSSCVLGTSRSINSKSPYNATPPTNTSLTSLALL